ncbi:MAG TPA: HAD-IIA family hydrolase [Candidatus Hydrogenedentes bacterium]|nr:HAD-IIA family hydrolase [Candidatus Hydrogenedentota bacterium]
MNVDHSALLAKLDCFLLDMDGTVYLGDRPIEGATAFIAFLKQTNRSFLFLTNNPTADRQAYARKLARMGIPVGPEAILTSGEATVTYLLTETPWRRVYTLGTPSFEEELRAAGIEPLADDPEAVILSFDKTLTYGKLERACLLLRAGLPYVATNPDKVCPTDYGYIPDCGAMAALLAEATGGRWPKFIGKPSPDFARAALHRLGRTPETAAMVGDRLYTDMAMARNAGMTGILVLSGETRPEDLKTAAAAPDLVFSSVAELREALQQADESGSNRV